MQDHKQKNTSTRRTLIISCITLGMLLLAVLLLSFAAFSRVEIQAEGWCNSGHINLDIEANNIIQNKTCMAYRLNNTTGESYTVPDPDQANLTCFRQDFMLKHIKLKDINGLNCQGSVKVRMPLILSLFMG